MGTVDKVLAATAGRDRVVDCVKAVALVLVVLGHSLAWCLLPTGGIDNTLNHAPQLWWLTWLLQVLPLFFFVAGSSFSRLTQEGTAAAYSRRATSLISPMILLHVVALLVAGVAHVVAPTSVQRTLGTLLVQLTWFLGVYLLLIASAPLLLRLRGILGAGQLVALIAVVDWLRVHVSTGIGWLNMFLVWALFALLGTQMPRLRKLSIRRLLLGFMGSMGMVVALISLGPYSKALITAAGIPGISNLAPPSLVLAAAGCAQIFALLLVWPMLSALLQRDRIWVPVAIFGSRAMQVYLYHLIFLIAAVLPFYAAHSSPRVLGPVWWLQHIAVLVVTLSCALLAAPVLRTWSSAIAYRTLIHIVPVRVAQRVRRARALSIRVMSVTLGLALLVQSATGVGDFLAPRTVLGLSVFPIVSWTVIVALSALLLVTQSKSSSRNDLRR